MDPQSVTPWRPSSEPTSADATTRLAAPATGDPATPSAGAPGPVPIERAKLSRRDRILAGIAIFVMLAGGGLVVGTFYVDSVPTPEKLPLPQSTTVFYADGKTPMAKLGTANRTLLAYDDMLDSVKQAIVAAEDQSYWKNRGIDFRGIMRAAWNNFTGGQTQGASTITQQYARIAADLKGVTYSRKLREAVMAWKLSDKYSKEEILEFYLNTVAFGRGAYGVEAAAQVYFGKSANKNAPAASRLTLSEAMVLVSMVKQPEADPDDPEGHPGYDPTRGPIALANSQQRWNYVRDGMGKLGYLTREQADGLTYPNTVKEFDASSHQSGLDKPTGLVVSHVLSELRQLDPFQGKGPDYIRNGGFQIVSTVDKRAQDAAEAAADIRRDTAPDVVQGQPANWQAALVAVEPGTGRVLAYYGGSDGAGADFAGWYYDDEGDPVGFGQHSPGSSFKVYDLAEALEQNVSMMSHWDSPASKEFPASGRTKDSAAGPISNSSSAECQPDCMLWQATVASLNVTFFDLTEHLGVPKVIDMAKRAGVDSMWANVNDKPTRIDLRGKSGNELTQYFSTEVGIGQYGITVLDHANGMATFAAGGRRAQAHFVRSVSAKGDQIYREQLTQATVGLNQDQINQLDWTLSQVPAAKLPNGWDSAGKTGTWQYGKSKTQNAHTWMVGYTGAIAAAVWLGTTDGKPLITKSGSTQVFGASYPATIWRQFLVDASAAMKLDRDKFRFGEAKFPEATPSAEPTPSPTPEETPSPTPVPTVTLPPPPPPPTTPPIGPSLTGAPLASPPAALRVRARAPAR
ncbi:MAG: transglycosylase domain-containing protein [Micromonosporaceae bacterium]